MVVLKIGSKEIELDPQVVRRIVNAAETNLKKLKELEGSEFPKIDRSAVKAVADLQYALFQAGVR